MKATRLGPVRAAAALVLAIAAAVAAVAGATSWSKPHDFETRVAAVNTQLRTARSLAAGAVARRFPADALCSLSNGGASERVGAQVKALAADAQFDHLDVQVSPTRERSGELIPLVVHVSGSGSYEGTLGLLQRLSTLRPMLFVDTLDLASKTSFVTFTLSGRVFCSAPQ